jgi:hypothetical protein
MIFVLFYFAISYNASLLSIASASFALFEILFCCLFGWLLIYDRVFLDSPGCPPTFNPPVLAPQVLGCRHEPLYLGFAFIFEIFVF